MKLAIIPVSFSVHVLYAVDYVDYYIVVASLGGWRVEGWTIPGDTLQGMTPE